MRQDSPTDPPTDHQNSPGTAARRSRPDDPAAVVLGYLNFSSGAFDPAVWRALNEICAAVEPAAAVEAAERGSGAGAGASSMSGSRRCPPHSTRRNPCGL